MGVYIKGMEMPTSCRACLYSRTDIRNVDWCVLTEKDLPCDCPIIPVPPHGDLIDCNVAYDKIAEQEGGNYVDMDAVGKGLEETPVVIPAEEEE